MKTCLAVLLALCLATATGCRCFSSSSFALPSCSGCSGTVNQGPRPVRNLWGGGTAGQAACSGNGAACWEDAGCGIEHCSSCGEGPGCGIESTGYCDPNCGIQSTGGCGGGCADGNLAPIIDGRSIHREALECRDFGASRHGAGSAWRTVWWDERLPPLR